MGLVSKQLITHAGYTKSRYAVCILVAWDRSEVDTAPLSQDAGPRETREPHFDFVCLSRFVRLDIASTF